MPYWSNMLELTKLDAAIAVLKAQAVAEMRLAVRTVTQRFFENTPVWSGDTVRNYSWGVGGPSGGHKAPSGSLPKRGDFSEKNRGANEAAAMAAAMSAIPAALADMHLTCTIPTQKWNLIDSGIAPAPGRSRYPGGVEMLSVQAARAALKNWK